MIKRTKLLAFVAVLVLVTSGISILSSWADDNLEEASVTAKLTYRTMFRHEVDELGGHEEGKLLRVNSTESLQAGLNKLSTDGWELVAVEGGRNLPLTGAGDPKAIYPPVYIFRRTVR